MSTVLIPTFAGDVHSLAVSILLEKRGHRGVRWFGADFPTRQTTTIRIGADSAFAWKSRGTELEISESEVDVVWYRRPNSPYLPTGTLEKIHPQDRWSAECELQSCFESLWYSIGQRAKWVNPHEAARRANSKVLQLARATALGIDVPKTLVSNDPHDAKNFIGECSETGCVYKLNRPAVWRRDDGAACFNATRVRADDLPSDGVLQLTPGIFQERVPKAHELRIVFMGEHYVALKLETGRYDSHLDWHSIGLSNVPTTLCELDPAIVDACQLLMKSLGLVFGCFDFIVTPDGRNVFLEVNEAGQFLFMETLHPAARVLDAFAEFIVDPRPDFRPAFVDSPLQFAQLRTDPEFRAMLLQDRQHLARFPPWADENWFWKCLSEGPPAPDRRPTSL